MNMSASHSSHMNITDSRKSAVRWINGNKGYPVHIDGKKYAKCRILEYIRRGMLDGYYYAIEIATNINGETIRVINLTSKDFGYTRKIGH